MSNMYGYTDYDGPRTVTTAAAIAASSTPIEDDDNPLQVGFWMEGDSMAPPCGTSVSTIHTILQFLQLNADDVLYDLGCGDGRICLEAWHQYQCRTIGIEVEEDLVTRAQTLITNVSSTSPSQSSVEPLLVQNLPQVHCMDLRQIFREWIQPTTNNNDDVDTYSKFPLPTVIFLYLLPEALSEIESSLLQILSIAPKNCRIVCNTWGIPNWNPTQVTTIPERTAVGVSTTIYVYTTDSVQETSISMNAE